MSSEETKTFSLISGTLKHQLASSNVGEGERGRRSDERTKRL